VIRSVLLLGLFGGLLGAASPSPRTQLPTAQRSDWTAADGRAIVSVQTSDGTLRGWSYSAPGGAPTILAFGGNGYSIASVDARLRGLVAQGANVIEYDYPGYGFSDGKPDMAAIQRDALQLYDASVKANGSAPVVVFGYSLGTAFASYVASQRTVRGLILISPFSNMTDEFEFLTSAEPGTFVLASNAATIDETEFITHSQAPLLVVHGDADRLIPIAEGRKVFAASPVSRKTFVAIPGNGHDGMLENPSTLAAIKAFLASL
jgi:uncharacterized protein